MFTFQDRGWRQGSVLPRDLALALIPTLTDDQVAVIVSQDCDLTNGSLEVEPTFEVVLACNPTVQNPEYQYGKNPRYLLLPVGVRWLECSMRNRYTLPREKLLDFAPCDTNVLAKRERKLLAKWMGLRYSRTSFPSEFNRRVKTNQKRVGKAQRACSMLSGIYLYVDGAELRSDQVYKILIVGLIPSDDESHASDQDRRSEAEQGLDKLREALTACQGIEVLDSELKSHREMTVHELLLLDRWDMDYLSDRDDPEGPVAPQP